MSEIFKEINGIIYHLSKTFNTKKEAREYVKERTKYNKFGNKETLAKIKMDRYYGIKPIYHVFIRIRPKEKK